MNITINGEIKEIEVVKIKMKHKLLALQKATTNVNGKREVDYAVMSIYEACSSVTGHNLTFEEYLELDLVEGDRLIELYKKVNYGGEGESEKFQEVSVGGKN